MKRTFSIIAISSVLLFGGLSVITVAPHVVRADAVTATPTTGTGAAPAAGNQPTGQDSGSGMLGFGQLMNVVIGTVVRLFAWFLGVAAITLDNSVYYTVIHIGGGSLLGNGLNSINAIGVAWRVLRDVGNIVLIFGFLAIGITTILDNDIYGGGTKLLPKLLIVAIFVNFSLFISEAIIDVSDVFATQIYTALNGGQTASSGISFSQVTNEGISSRIMSNLGLATVYNVDGDPSLLGGDHPLFVGLLAILLFLVATFVFFALALILITRFVALVFLVVVAPVGFVGLAVPRLERLAKNWWETLFQQSITAPILLLLLYIAVAVITDSHFLAAFGTNSSQALTGAVANPTPSAIASLAGIILSFIVAMGLLLAVIAFAKRMSAFGADLATSTAGKLSFGAAGWVGRKTIGRKTNQWAHSVQNSALGRTEFGRYLTTGLKYGANASFDVRGSGLLGAVPGGGVSAGKAQHGGYHHDEEESEKARLEYAKTIGQSHEQENRTKLVQDLIDSEKKEIKRIEDEFEKNERTENENVNNKKKDLAKKKAAAQALKDARANSKLVLSAAAEAARDADIRKAEEDAAKAEEEFDKAEQKLTDVRENFRKDKKTRNGRVEKWEKEKEGLSAAANQRQYAQSLDRVNENGELKNAGTRFALWATSVGHANEGARKKIIANSKKSPVELRLESIEAKAGKGAAPAANDSHGSAPAAAPTQKPAASGGGHAH